MNSTTITQAFATALILAGAALAVVSLGHGTDAARHDVITVALALISGGFGVFVGHATSPNTPPAAPPAAADNQRSRTV